MKLVNDNNRIELIKSLNQNSSVYNHKIGYNHICYEIDSLNDFKNKLKK